MSPSPSYATRIEGLLSKVRDRYPDKLPLQEEQRLLKDLPVPWEQEG